MTKNADNTGDTKLGSYTILMQNGALTESGPISNGEELSFISNKTPSKLRLVAATLLLITTSSLAYQLENSSDPQGDDENSGLVTPAKIDAESMP